MASGSQFTVTKLALPGIRLITPRVHKDARGFFIETYTIEAFATLGIPTQFVQDNLSYSTQKVLRGLHRQLEPYAQDKLVRCTHGAIFDVAADIDPLSPTFGQHVSVTLRADEGTMLYIPGQYVHGFCVLGDEAVVEYKVSRAYAPQAAVGVRYDDPTLAIPWPIKDPVLSPQDAALEHFTQ